MFSKNNAILTCWFLEVSSQVLQLSLKVISLWRGFAEVERIASGGGGESQMIIKRLLYISCTCTVYVHTRITHITVCHQRKKLGELLTCTDSE